MVELSCRVHTVLPDAHLLSGAVDLSGHGGGPLVSICSCWLIQEAALLHSRFSLLKDVKNTVSCYTWYLRSDKSDILDWICHVLMGITNKSHWIKDTFITYNMEKKSLESWKVLLQTNDVCFPLKGIIMNTLSRVSWLLNFCTGDINVLLKLWDISLCAICVLIKGHTTWIQADDVEQRPLQVPFGITS